MLFALRGVSDEEILHHFVEARLPFRIHEDLYTLISVIRNPIAVRSSSLLEDSHYQPFCRDLFHLYDSGCRKR